MYVKIFQELLNCSNANVHFDSIQYFPQFPAKDDL